MLFCFVRVTNNIPIYDFSLKKVKIILLPDNFNNLNLKIRRNKIFNNINSNGKWFKHNTFV